MNVNMTSMNNITFNLLGIPTNPTNLQETKHFLFKWIEKKETGHYVIAFNVHNYMKAFDHEDYFKVIQQASICVPDGRPISLIHRLSGFKNSVQVRGMDLMESVISGGIKKGIKHYFYGGTKGISVKLKRFFEEKYPGVSIVGTHCPPFTQLTTKEDMSVCQAINQSRADIVWVGLSSPKQDYWMADHKNKLNCTVQLGVGAAFDFLTGTKKSAPKWVQLIYLEWFYRWLQEPRRLFKRFFVLNFRFLWIMLLRKRPQFLTG